MNRAQKRKYVIALRKKGFSLESAKRIAEMKVLDDVKPVIAVGDKVRLKYDAITQSPDYDRRVENYKKFVENSKDKVFTTESYKGYNKLFCFVEDETEIKWVFHEYDLEKVEESE